MALTWPLSKKKPVKEKPLPFRTRRNLHFLVPTRSSRRVDQLCLLPRCVSTVGSPEIAKGSVVPLFLFLFFSFSSPPCKALPPLLLVFLPFLSFSSFLFLFLLLFFSFLFPFLSFFLFFSFLFFSHRIVWFASSERKLPLTLLFILPCVTFSMVHVSYGHMF